MQIVGDSGGGKTIPVKVSLVSAQAEETPQAAAEASSLADAYLESGDREGADAP
jgi:hypothetical protein